MPGSYFIAKLYRQHNSAVIVVPRPVLAALSLKAGEHLVFVWQIDTGTFVVQKFIPEGVKHGGDAEHSDNQDRSRATQAADRR